MVELVIKLPEELYKVYKDRPPKLGDAGLDMIAQSIAKGVLLPKGHGDLKDMNDLCYKSQYGCKDNCDYLHTCSLYSASTIVKANNTESK